MDYSTVEVEKEKLVPERKTLLQTKCANDQELRGGLRILQMLDDTSIKTGQQLVHDERSSPAITVTVISVAGITIVCGHQLHAVVQLNDVSHSILHSQPLLARILRSASLRLPFSDSMYKWDWSLFVFLCLTHFSGSEVLRIHLCFLQMVESPSSERVKSFPLCLDATIHTWSSTDGHLGGFHISV